MCEFCDKLYSALGDFLVPLEISYSITNFDQDREIRPDTDTGEMVRRELRNDAGIGFSEFLESTAIERQGVQWIPRVSFDRNRYIVYFDGTDYGIKRSDCTRYQNGEPHKGVAIPDPLDLTIIHRPARNILSETADHVLAVSVTMHSDLWLYTSANGEKNREYLRRFFSDIAETISAESVKRDKYKASDFWNDLSVYSGDDDYINLQPEEIY
jgi:hypothetical protein